MIHYFHGSLLTLASDTFEAAAEHPDAIAQKRAVGGVVNVAFDDRGIRSKFSSLGYGLLAGQTDHPLMNLFGDGRAQQGKEAAEGSEIRGGLGVEVRERR